MADIFISYARVDLDRVRPIAEALQAHGWKIWWDLTSLRTGQSFNQAIRKALSQADCVLVLWSRTSIESRWVEAEASWAWENDKLASVVLDDGLRPPFPFQTGHAENLCGWAGDTAAPEYSKLLADLTEVLGPPAEESPPATGGASSETGTARQQPKPGRARQQPKPDWANAGGRDRFGEWAEIAVERGGGEPVVQRLRWIAPGRFAMGSAPDEPGRYDWEGPRHEVAIARGFWLFDTPCTQALWEALVGKNPSFFEHPDRPVEQVSWVDVHERFLPALNARMPGFALPTEAQWEYACRAGTRTALYTGPIEILGEANAPALDPIAWYGGNSGVGFELKNGLEREWLKKKEMQYPKGKAGTHPVKGRQPNPWGLYDMLGNVWEWTQDAWQDSYEGAPVDGSARETTEAGAVRVGRGGSWNYDARHCRCAFRDRVGPDSRDNDLGFRCARAQVS